MNSGPIFRLSLLGRPSLTRADGGPLGGRAVQRHRLALLALLARSGASSRDHLMGLLWPESELDRARKLLNTSVYVLRHALGEGAIVSVADELRLAPDVVTTDVTEFEAAFDGGDHERAVTLYRGAFLDGFFLASSPGFGQWLEAQRERLAARYAGALASLADTAERRGDLPVAVDVWQMAAAHDPYDSRVALRLMSALAACGNPGGAVRHAATHVSRLERELGVEPPAELLALTAQLRAESGHAGSNVSAMSAGFHELPDSSFLTAEPSLRLITLGGLELLSSGRPVSASCPRDALLLLAILAASGDTGISAEAVLLLLWPDASRSAARDALEISLAEVRASVHPAAIDGTDMLTLRSSVVSSDVTDFRRALDRGRPDDAGLLYRGAFLDRVALPDSPELGRWVEEQRTGLAGRAAALQGLVSGPLEDAAHPATARTTSLRSRAPRTDVGAALTYGVFALLLLLLILILTRQNAVPLPAAVPSIAVLPLRNPAGDPASAVLADAMTEQLITTLGRDPEQLRAISITSVLPFRDRSVDVREIADRLGAGSVLEGSLQKTDTRLLVQLRLVDAGDGSTRWSQTYERELRDIFAVQAEVARAVVGELLPRLSASITAHEYRAPTSDLAAWELYLRGSDPRLLRSDSTTREGIQLFQQAIALDSTFAGAHAGLARLYVVVQRLDLPRRTRHELAEQHARTAILLDSSLAEAHATLGLVHMGAFDFAAAEADMRRALRLDPTRARTREWLASVHIWTGRYEDALIEAEQALESDPLSPSAHAEVARALLVNGRCDEALVHLDHISGVQPPLARTASIQAQCLAGKGLRTQAIDLLRNGQDSGNPRVRAMLAYHLALDAQMEEARRIRAELAEHWQATGDGAFQLATVHVGLGEYDQAFDWLERSTLDYSLTWEIMEPMFEELRRDPRFQLVQQRLGIQNR